jgi:hypothetical protein
VAKSRKRAAASAPERAEPRIETAFDFLYADFERIGLLSTQFSDYGTLRSIEASDSVAASAGRTVTTGVTGGIAVVKGQRQTARQTSEGQNEGIKSTFDPLWANVLEFKDTIEERGFVHSDLAQTRIGQFLKIGGALSVVNSSIMKTIMSNETVKGGYDK